MLNLLLYTLALLFASQLVSAGNSSHGNSTDVSNTPASGQGQTGNLPEGYRAFPDVGAAYKFYGVPTLQWDSARLRCNIDGGTLAVIDSWKKAEHAWSIVEHSWTTPHVGIHKLSEGGEWRSVKSGLPLTSLPWRSSESPSTTRNLHAGLYNAQQGLVALRSDFQTSYLCELPISENGRRLLPVPT